MGFVMECSADFTKYAFKQNPANKGHFVDVGENHSWQCHHLFWASSNTQAMYQSQDMVLHTSINGDSMHSAGM